MIAFLVCAYVVLAVAFLLSLCKAAGRGAGRADDRARIWHLERQLAEREA